MTMGYEVVHSTNTVHAVFVLKCRGALLWSSNHILVYSKSGKSLPQGSGPGIPYISAALSSGYFSNLKPPKINKHRYQ